MTEHANFISKKNPHKIIREIQKKERQYMFAVYDQMVDPAIFKQVLSQLPTQKQFPQEMCQLIVKDFELSFSKLPNTPESDMIRQIDAQKFFRT